MKKSVRFVTGIALLILMLLLTSIFALADEHEHIYSSNQIFVIYPTCMSRGKKARICTVSGCNAMTDVEYVAKLDHSYAPATCTKPEICVNGCNQTRGVALGHRPDPNSATCKNQEKCRVCGAVTGDFGPHKFTTATCIQASICTVCKAVSGVPNLNNHSFSNASCTSPATCRWCGIVKGNALGHIWIDNGTTVICSRCGSSRLKKPARQ